jgi:hypothetical protein
MPKKGSTMTARSSMHLVLPSLLLWVMSTLCTACGQEPNRLELTHPDLRLFKETAYPILLRDCGFPECHGNPKRFFRLFGPGRTRLDPSLASDDPATDDEISQSYTRAVSMLVNESTLADSWLLRKPLDTLAGGSSHEGEDSWGRNVYASTDDPGYLALVRWAYSRPKDRQRAPEATP